MRADINQAGPQAIMESSSARRQRAAQRCGGKIVKEWFAGLNQREQLSLLLLAAVWSSTCLHACLAPLADRGGTAGATEPGHRPSLQRVDAMVSQIMQLRDGGGAGHHQRNLTALVNQSTSRRGLQVSRLQPTAGVISRCAWRTRCSTTCWPGWTSWKIAKACW